MQKYFSFFSSFLHYTILLYENDIKNVSNRKISQLIILRFGNVSMHDSKSATLAILLNGVLSAMKIGSFNPLRCKK